MCAVAVAQAACNLSANRCDVLFSCATNKAQVRRGDAAAGHARRAQGHAAQRRGGARCLSLPLGFASSRCFEPFDLSDDVDDVLCLSCERAAMGWVALGMLAYGLICMWGFGRWAKAATARGEAPRLDTRPVGCPLEERRLGLQEMAGWHSP